MFLSFITKINTFKDLNTLYAIVLYPVPIDSSYFLKYCSISIALYFWSFDSPIPLKIFYSFTNVFLLSYKSSRDSSFYVGFVLRDCAFFVSFSYFFLIFMSSGKYLWSSTDLSFCKTLTPSCVISPPSKSTVVTSRSKISFTISVVTLSSSKYSISSIRLSRQNLTLSTMSYLVC